MLGHCGASPTPCFLVIKFCLHPFQHMPVYLLDLAGCSLQVVPQTATNMQTLLVRAWLMSVSRQWYVTQSFCSYGFCGSVQCSKDVILCADLDGQIH